MTELSIGNLGMPDEGAWLVVQGSDQPEGLISTNYELSTSLDPLVEEKLLLNLRASTTRMRSIIDSLEALLRRGKESTYMPLTLRIWSNERSAYLYSLIRHGRLEVASGQLRSQQAGSMQLHLVIQRENSFFSAEQPVPISNSSGGGITNGLTLFNHDDSQVGHDNWFTIDTSALELTQPASLRLEFENNFVGDSLDDLWVGGMADTSTESRPKLNLEAEDGAGGTVLNSTRASAGKYARYGLSGSSWANLATWTIGPVEVSQLRSRVCTPILRLFSPVSESPLSLRLLISIDNNIVWQSPETTAEVEAGVVVLEPISLPLGSLPLLNYAYAHQIILQARHAAAGSHTLELDDMLLLPHEPFAFFHSISALAYQAILVDDGILNSSWSLKQGLEIKTHHRVGVPLVIRPSYKQHFWCFQTGSNGAPIDRTMKVKALMRKHWRLP